MAHALQRISFATCDPEFRLFAYMSHNPSPMGTAIHCHVFMTKYVRQVRAEHCNTFIKSRGWKQGAENTRKVWHSGFKRKVDDLSIIKTFTVTGHGMTCSVILYAAFQICFFHIGAWENMTANATSVWIAKRSEWKQSHYGSMFYTCIRCTHGV